MCCCGHNIHVHFYTKPLIHITIASFMLNCLKLLLLLTSIHCCDGNGVSNAVTECFEDFYLDNSSGVCRPECGQWDQYSPATRRAVYGINITFVLLTIVICVVTFVWSIFRHRVM